MIPYRIGTPASNAKELDSIVRGTRTDIERLWRLQQQRTEGEVVGGQPPAGPTTSAPVLDEWEGVLLADIAPPATRAIGWSASAPTVTALEYVVDPSSTTTPRAMIPGTTVHTITIRDRTKAGFANSRCWWKEVTLSDGSTEKRLLDVECPI